MSIKVKNAKNHTTALQKEIMVTEGKLICGNVGSFSNTMEFEELIGKLRPIIISETESLPENTQCKVYNSITDNVEDYFAVPEVTIEGIFLVLALPEQFSKGMIDVILSGRLKAGNSVLVECERVVVHSASGGVYPKDEFKITLKEDKYVSLYPAEEKKQEVALSEIPSNFKLPEPKIIDFSEKQIAEYQKLLETHPLPEISINQIFFKGADFYKEAITAHLTEQISKKTETPTPVTESATVTVDLGLSLDEALKLVESAMRYAYNLGLTKDGVGGSAGVKEWFDEQIKNK